MNSHCNTNLFATMLLKVKSSKYCQTAKFDLRVIK